MNNVRLLFLATHPLEVASTRYRVLAYEPALREAGYEIQFHPFFPSESLEELYAPGKAGSKTGWLLKGARKRLEVLRGTRYDLVFIHRELFPLGLLPGMALLEGELRRHGAPVIYDFDDAIFLPHRRNRGLVGKLENTHSVRHLIALSRRVIAGNSFLAEYAAKLNPDVVCLPTPVDTDRYVPRSNNPGGSLLTVGWIGSPSTAKYLLSLTPVFQQLARTHRFRLKVVGAGQPVRIPGVEVDCKGWDLQTEAEEFRNCDIGVYPLWDDEWSRGKCGYKALQFMASGVPVVASAIGMNNQIIRHGTDGLLARSPEEWLPALERLLDGSELRRRLGDAGRRSVEEQYALSQFAPKFLQALEEILPASKRHAPVLRVGQNGTSEPGHAPAPRLNSETVVCVSSIDWDFNWQGHQEVMSAFADQGNTVLFIENTGIRVPGLKDLSRLGARLANWRRNVGGIRKIRERLWVCSPVIFPFPYSRLAGTINRFLLYRTIREWLRLVGSKNPILWTFLPTRITLDLMDVLDPELVVYYCIADFEKVGPSRKVRKAQQALLRRTDVVFAQGELLAQRCRPFVSNVSIFPFGVRPELFERPELMEIPEELAKIPRPRIGYVGALQRHVDFELLGTLADRHPDWSIVLVGPSQEPAQNLRQKRNVFWLGSQPHEKIPQHMAHFDVCLIPYCLNPYTQTVYPTKLYEYLSLGKPVVSTALPEVLEIARGNSALVRIGENAGQFEAHVREALDEKDPRYKELRKAVARTHSWPDRIDSMSGILEEALRTKRRARSEGWSGILRRTSQRLMWRALLLPAGVLCVYLLFFQTPLLWWAASPLRISDPPRKADAVVVFAGGVGESGQAGEGYEERVKQAVQLYQQGYAPEILLISGFTRIFREADVMALLTESLGVPDAAIRKETRVGSTKDYVLQVKETARQRGWKRILLVTSPYHGRRADLTFRRNAPGLQVVHTPAHESGYYAPHGAITYKQLRGILHEMFSILYYRLKGWL